MRLAPTLAALLLGLAPAWLPWRPVEAMAAQGFWIALVVGLSIAAVGLVWLLHRLSLQWMQGVSPPPLATGDPGGGANP